MINLNNFLERWSLISIASFSFFLFWIITSTIYSSQPVYVTDSIVLFKNVDGKRAVNEIRKLNGLKNVVVRLTHNYYSEENPSNFFTMEGGLINVRVGTFTSVYITELPTWVKGRWCSKTDIIYRPMLSQRDHIYETKDICFETTEYE